MSAGKAYRRRLARRRADRIANPTVLSPWPRCPEAGCGRIALKQHGDGCWVCERGHQFRTPGQPGMHVEVVP